MKIVVEMTSEEFTEFMDWRKDKQKYEKKIPALKSFAKKVDWAVEPDPKKPGKYKIKDQDHMDDLYMMAGDMLAE